MNNDKTSSSNGTTKSKDAKEKLKTPKAPKTTKAKSTAAHTSAKAAKVEEKITKKAPAKAPKAGDVKPAPKAKSVKPKKEADTKPKAKVAKVKEPKVASKPKTAKTKKPKQIELEEDLPLLALSLDEPKVSDIKASGKTPVILQILPELKLGGVERGTIEIAKAGKKLGYEMLVASEGGHLVNQLVSANIKHIKLPLASKNPFVMIENIRAIRRIIKEYKVDIVHARSRAPAWSAYFAAKKAKCNFMTTFHGVYSITSPFKKFYNSIMTKGKVVIAISEFIKDHMLENYTIDPAKVRVVPRGVDLEQFTRDKVQKIRIINMAELFKIELDVPVILLPGRFAKWKGHCFLLDALEKIKDQKFVCIFAGYDKNHDSLYKELERKVKDYGLFQKVRIIGAVKDMPALYSLSDIVVSASTLPEAFGRVAIEGQAMERMVVATNHGGSCETVQDGKNGYLVAPDDVDGLAKILKDLINISEKERKTVVTNARKNIENNFSMENMVNKTFAVYNELLGR